MVPFSDDKCIYCFLTHYETEGILSVLLCSTLNNENEDCNIQETSILRKSCSNCRIIVSTGKRDAISIFREAFNADALLFCPYYTNYNSHIAINLENVESKPIYISRVT